MIPPIAPLKILLAEDDLSTAQILRRVLKSRGYRVEHVEDGDSAWDAILTGECQLVISDWAMPGIDGLELCRRVRAYSSADAYTYIILLTARSEPGAWAEGFAAGADDFLTKPVDCDELLARLGAARRILAMQTELRRRSLQLEAMHDELQNQCAKLIEVATSDGLTGLKNRRHFRDSLETSFTFASRQHLPLSVVMLDVDYFKSYNDQFGHVAGDAALVEIGRILRQNARDHDVVARFGGEEFAMILPGTDAPGAARAAERLREEIEARAWPLRPVTASFGAASSTPSTMSPIELVEEADKALYESKRRGRNRVTHFERTQAIVS